MNAATTTTTPRRRVRPAALALIGLGVAGLGLASASVLDVNASTHVVSGVDTFASCAEGAVVQAAYEVDRASIGTGGALTVTDVTVSDIPPTCFEHGLQVALLDADGQELVRWTADRIGDPSVTLPVSGVTNHEVDSVAVIIG